MYKLYIEGDGASGPLGVKETTSWLNRHGYRTRRGAHFGVGPLHRILKNACYATGKWRYGIRNSRTGTLHDPASVVEIPVPTILSVEVFERVQARLSLNRPQVTPPRVVNGPTLLAGLAVCAACGAGMTLTGTRRRGRVYSYYSCGGHHQKGTSICRGYHVPMSRLDHLIIENVKESLFGTDRLARILKALIQRQGAQNLAVETRRSALEAEAANRDDRLRRLYRAVEEGIIELDGDLKARIEVLKQERDVARTAIDRMVGERRIGAAITPIRLEAFSRLMRKKLDSGDVRQRQSYLRSVIARIEVGEGKVRVFSDRAALAAAAAGQHTGPQKVRGFVRNWRTRRDSNSRPLPSEGSALSS
jgi:site-specific DNA recombinase